MSQVSYVLLTCLPRRTEGPCPAQSGANGHRSCLKLPSKMAAARIHQFS